MRLWLFVLMFALLAGPAMAQQVPTASEDPVANAPIRLGALAFVIVLGAILLIRLIV